MLQSRCEQPLASTPAQPQNFPEDEDSGRPWAIVESALTVGISLSNRCRPLVTSLVILQLFEILQKFQEPGN